MNTTYAMWKTIPIIGTLMRNMRNYSIPIA